jgi:hypothetical protein
MKDLVGVDAVAAGKDGDRGPRSQRFFDDLTALLLRTETALCFGLFNRYEFGASDRFHHPEKRHSGFFKDAGVGLSFQGGIHRTLTQNGS